MANKKLKLLYLARYLQEETDERHPKTVQEMITYLERCGISAERKSIYADLDALRDYGMDILRRGGPGGGYFVGARDFELAELKLLVDAVDPDQAYARVYGREGQVGARGREIGIHAVRGGTVAGEHRVIFYGEDEVIEFAHSAASQIILHSHALT